MVAEDDSDGTLTHCSSDEGESKLQPESTAEFGDQKMNLFGTVIFTACPSVLLMIVLIHEACHSVVVNNCSACRRCPSRGILRELQGVTGYQPLQ